MDVGTVSALCFYLCRNNDNDDLHTFYEIVKKQWDVCNNQSQKRIEIMEGVAAC